MERLSVNIFAYPLKYFLNFRGIEEGDEVAYLSKETWVPAFLAFASLMITMLVLTLIIQFLIPGKYSGFDITLIAIMYFGLMILAVSNSIWFVSKHKLRLV